MTEKCISNGIWVEWVLMRLTCWLKLGANVVANDKHLMILQLQGS